MDFLHQTNNQIVITTMSVLTYTFLTLLVTLPSSQGQSTTITSLTFEVNEGFSDTYVGNVKQSTFFQTRFESAVLDTLVLGLLASGSHEDHVTLFKIDPESGVLRTDSEIDREAFCPMLVDCFLYFDVVIQQPVEFVQAVTVSVRVLDTNDDLPIFDPSEVTLVFSEAAQEKSSRSLQLALDYDSPQNGVKSYELISNTDLFSLESTMTSGPNPVFSALRLVLEGSLDHEQKASYEMLVAAYDTTSSDQSRRGILTVTVEVSDDNDNEPIFDATTLELSISEATEPIQKITQVQATDQDSGDNARLTYLFTPSTLNAHGRMFTLNNHTGEIYLKGLLDYELQQSYTLQITARDAGSPQSRFSTADVIIHVTDENDNSPVININTFGQGTSARVSESTPPNSFIAQVSVFDSDSGDNGQIVCSLPHPMFTLESLSGVNQFKVVTSGELDREQQEIYSLHVTCADQGQVPRQVTESLVVTVTDENDNAPTLSPMSFNINVDENNQVGDVILQLNASDPDKAENGRLTYLISQGEISSLLVVDENTGTVRAVDVFNFEKIKSINFAVDISDNGASPHRITIPIRINIQDVNDEIPTFTETVYQFQIRENSAAHIPIGNLTAHDLDSYPYNQFVFSIPEAFSNIPFYINQDTGILKASDTFDREEKDAYHFTVEVTDLDELSFSSTATVIVTILDENDNTPEIVYPMPQNSTIQISNALPVGSNIVSVQVHDTDADQNGNCTYYLADPSQEDAFIITSTGIIKTNRDFSGITYKEYKLMIHVQDKGSPPLSSSRRISIIVDRNIAYLFAPNTEDEQGGSNIIIIATVSVISVFIVIGLIVAIAVIKLRGWRGQRGQRGGPDRKYLGPYTIEAEGKGEARLDGEMQQTPEKSGFTNMAFVENGGVGVSLHPSGHIKGPAPHPASRSTSPDSMLYDLKLEKVQTQKAYLSQLKGVDHDTSSSGSTDDSGRGPSEEGGDIGNRQSPFNDSSDQVPNINDLYSKKPGSSKKTAASSSGRGTSTQNTTAAPQVHPKPKPHLGLKFPVKIPPSYETYMRSKANRSAKRVNFALEEEVKIMTGSAENLEFLANRRLSLDSDYNDNNNSTKQYSLDRADNGSGSPGSKRSSICDDINVHYSSGNKTNKTFRGNKHHRTPRDPVDLHEGDKGYVFLKHKQPVVPVTVHRTSSLVRDSLMYGRNGGESGSDTEYRENLRNIGNSVDTDLAFTPGSSRHSTQSSVSSMSSTIV